MKSIQNMPKVGDLVEPASAFRRARRGIGVVIQVVKEKFQPTRVEVMFPLGDQGFRKNKIWLFVKDLRIVSESRGSGKAEA
jgi:hypothetical protein